ncbi:hypothetical protein V8F20_008992 [Naviculisporaceae sp. PSN 640]
MTDTNLDQWLELKRPQEHVPLSEHYSELQLQQRYDFAYFLLDVEDSVHNDQQVCPPTPPSSGPSSQVEAVTESEPGSSEGAEEERREADRRSLARLLVKERLEEEEARRQRAAAVKKAALPIPRPLPLPIPIRQPSQPRSPVKQEHEPQSIPLPQGQRLPPLRESRELRTPSRRQMTPPIEYPMQQARIQQASTPPQEIPLPRQQNGTGGAFLGAIYENMSMREKRLEERINGYVEEVSSEIQSLKDQIKRDRAIMQDFLKERFGYRDADCENFWDGLNNRLRNTGGQSLAVRPNQPPAPGIPRRAETVIESLEESIRIKQERVEEEGADEIVEERGDEGEAERADEALDQALDQHLNAILADDQDQEEEEEDGVSGGEPNQIKVEPEEEEEEDQEEDEEEEEAEEAEEAEEEQEVEVGAEVGEDNEEDDEDDSPEPDDSDDPDYYDPYDIEKTPVAIEVVLGSARRAPLGVKRKALEMDSDEEEPQQAARSKKPKPAWVQVVSPVPNPHLRQQAELLQTVRKWYKEGGSRNPLILE